MQKLMKSLDIRIFYKQIEWFNFWLESLSDPVCLRPEHREAHWQFLCTRETASTDGYKFTHGPHLLTQKSTDHWGQVDQEAGFNTNLTSRDAFLSGEKGHKDCFWGPSQGGIQLLDRKTTHSPFSFVFTDLGCTEGRPPPTTHPPTHPGGLDWILPPRESKKLPAGAFDLPDSLGWIEILSENGFIT